MVLLAAWYVILGLAITVGVVIGRRIEKPGIWRVADSARLFDRTVLVLLSIVATVGVAASYYVVTAQVSIGTVLSNNSGNQLAGALGGNYGLQTLRYAAILSSGIAAYQRAQRRASSRILLYNLALLGLTALLSSRLSLVFALMIFLFLRYRQDVKQIRVRSIIGIALAGFLVLTPFNEVRNGNYYETQGVTNPLAMNYYQILSYLGAPAQVSLGVSDAIVAGTPTLGGPISSLKVVEPAFLADSTNPTPARFQRYPSSVDIAGELTANSSFADTYVDGGIFGLFYLVLVAAAAGVVYGHFESYRSVLSTGAAIALYGIAELWRTLILPQGIILFPLLALFGSGVVGSALWHTKTGKPGRYSREGPAA